MSFVYFLFNSLFISATAVGLHLGFSIQIQIFYSPADGSTQTDRDRLQHRSL